MRMPSGARGRSEPCDGEGGLALTSDDEAAVGAIAGPWMRKNCADRQFFLIQGRTLHLRALRSVKPFVT